MRRTVKVGIVGIGGYGRLLLDLFLEEQEKGAARVEVAVVKDAVLDAEHLAYLKKCSPKTRVFRTLGEAIDSGVELDLMVLPVGIGAHKPLAEASLKAGWNVMVEKPLAGSVEEAEAIVRAAEGSDRFVAVGFQDMYGPVVPEMKQALLSGIIGEVCSVRVLGIWGRSVEYFNRNEWAGRLVCNGEAIYDSPFNNAFAHYLNLALFLAGADLESVAVPLSAEGLLWRAHAIESCDTACLKWETDSGPDVSVFFSHASSGSIEPEIVVEGTRGTLSWKFQSHWEIFQNSGTVVRHEVPSVEDTRRFMVRQLLEKVDHPETNACTVRQALSQVKAVALAHQQVEIQTIPEAWIHRHATTSEDGQVSEWLDVEGLMEAGQQFLAGEDGEFGLKESCASGQVVAV